MVPFTVSWLIYRKINKVLIFSWNKLQLKMSPKFQNIAWKIEDLKAAEDEQSKKSVFDFDAHEEDKV